MTVKKSGRRKEKQPVFEGILDMARLLSSSSAPAAVVENVLLQICRRLGKRARCALLEGDDLTLRFWAGDYTCPVGGMKVNRDSVVWNAVEKGEPINLTDGGQARGYRHTLQEAIDVKAVIPLDYVDPLTEEKRKLGALIVDSGERGVPISKEDFEYLQVIGELISALAGRAELVRQLTSSCRRQEAILTETAHNFRNRIAAIGGFSRSIARLARDTQVADRAGHLMEEVKALESHVAEFEKYMNLKD